MFIFLFLFLIALIAVLFGGIVAFKAAAITALLLLIGPVTLLIIFIGCCIILY